MSVIFNATLEAAKRTANIVAGNSDYTCLFYVKFTSTPVSVGQTAFLTVNGVGTYTQFAGIYRNPDTTIQLTVNNGSGNNNSASIAVADGSWVRAAYVRQGSANRFYAQAPNGALTLVGTVTLSMGATTLTETWIGDDGGSETGLEIAYFREWDNDLNITQLLTEFQRIETVEDSSNINGDWPLTADLDDISGLSHDWTAVGSVTFDAAEPAFPSNNTRDTAEPITTLPFSTTQDVFLNGFAYPVWYQYEAQFGDVVLDLWGYSDPLTPYQVIAKAYRNALTANFVTGTSGSGFPINKSLRFSVFNSSTYYIEFSPSGNVALTEAELTIEAELAESTTVPVGSILVNDDTNADYFPATFVSSVDGDDYNTLKYVNSIAIGEGGDVLTNGTILLADRILGELRLYTSSLVLTTTVAIDIGSTRALRTCNGTQTFFVAAVGGAPTVVSEISGAGAIVESWSMTGITNVQAICANNDKTILYNSSTASGPVRRWDLVNDVALSDFVATLAGGYRVIDILVLADDSILVSWQIIGGGATSDFIVKRYDSAATLLDTYTFTSQLIVGAGACRMAYAIDNPNSFWVWLHDPNPNAGITRFRNVKVSDGSTLAEVEAVEFFGGSYSPDATLTPASRNGPSRSCPFLITRASITPTPPPTPGFNTRAVKRRWLRRGPIFSKENARVRYNCFQLDCQTGTGNTVEPGKDPQVYMRYSDDWGQTWSFIMPMPMGKLGQYGTQMQWWRLGVGRNRVFEVYGSDPVQVALLDGFARVSPGNDGDQ